MIRVYTTLYYKAAACNQSRILSVTEYILLYKEIEGRAFFSILPMGVPASSFLCMTCMSSLLYLVCSHQPGCHRDGHTSASNSSSNRELGRMRIASSYVGGGGRRL